VSEGFNGRYVLNEQGQPMPEPDLLTWARWMENIDARRVEYTELESGAWISTVFLGLDHSWAPFTDPLSYKPVLWETMIFEEGTQQALFQRRYVSREDALRGHWEAVEMCRQKEAAEHAELGAIVEQIAQTEKAEE